MFKIKLHNETKEFVWAVLTKVENILKNTIFWRGK